VRQHSHVRHTDASQVCVSNARAADAVITHTSSLYAHVYTYVATHLPLHIHLRVRTLQPTHTIVRRWYTGVEKLEVRVRVVGSENARKGFLGFLRRRSGSLAEVGAEDGQDGARGTKGKLGGWGRAALPRSCAQHFNRFHLRACERASGPGKRERVKGGYGGG